MMWTPRSQEQIAWPVRGCCIPKLGLKPSHGRVQAEFTSADSGSASGASDQTKLTCPLVNEPGRRDRTAAAEIARRI
jgi:hypothetical protein